MMIIERGTMKDPLEFGIRRYELGVRGKHLCKQLVNLSTSLLIKNRIIIGKFGCYV